MSLHEEQRNAAAPDMNPGPKGGKRSFLLPFLVFLLGVGAGGVLFSGSAGKLDLAGVLAYISKDAQSPAPDGKKPGEPKVLYYVDPMNPTLRTDKPGKAPCGMDLVPVYEEEAAPTPEGESLPPGTVKISPQRQQLIGVQTAEVGDHVLSRSIRAVGKVTYDETTISHVHTKFPGWIETVHVNFVGKPVKKNQPLVSIYSPELVATQQELLIAKKSKDFFQNSRFEGIGSGSASLYEATKDRLRLWDIDDAQIKEIEKRGAPIKSLTLYSTVDGIVTARNVYAGQQVAPEMELYTIADLSKIWVVADVYEYEVPMISLGQSASVTFSYLPGKVLLGKVNFISPELDPKTRTLKVRIELRNPGLEMKPDMFASVEFKLDYGKNLAVPAEAVLDSGSARTVFVVREGGYFEPRRVTLGQQVDDLYIVLDGLKHGERVVTSANFLIDSESQLKSALGDMGGVAGASAGHSGHTPAVPQTKGEGNHASIPPDNTGASDRSGSTGGSGATLKVPGHAGHSQ